jgi:hypothetical protein
MLQLIGGPVVLVWTMIGHAIVSGRVAEENNRMVLWLAPACLWAVWLITDLFVSVDGKRVPMD